MALNNRSILPIFSLIILSTTAIAIIFLNYTIGHISHIESKQEEIAEDMRAMSNKAPMNNLSEEDKENIIPFKPRITPMENIPPRRMPPPQQQFSQPPPRQEAYPAPWGTRPPQPSQPSQPIPQERPQYREPPQNFYPPHPFDFPEDEDMFYPPEFDDMPYYDYYDYEGRHELKKEPNNRMAESVEEELREDEEEEYFYEDDEYEEEDF